MTTVFYLFRDSPLRRSALALGSGAPVRYSLYGMDGLAERGYTVGHNLERPPARWARPAGAFLKWVLERAGGYGGDFATVLSLLAGLNRADAVVSTVDTVGIPLMLLARGRIVRSPFVYIAIGLPERLARLRSRRLEQFYARALGSAAAVVAYSPHEADVIQRWLRERGADVTVEFVPFGVDTDAFCPVSTRPDLDVVSVGADPHRDVDLLLAVARTMPDVGFLVVTTAERARSLGGRPANVTVETDLPFDEMRLRLERARVVALPVRDNSYSGATTVLLQAMALARPVVSREPPRSRRATGSRTETTCGSYHRGTPRPSVLRSQTCSTTRLARRRSARGHVRRPRRPSTGRSRRSAGASCPRREGLTTDASSGGSPHHALGRVLDVVDRVYRPVLVGMRRSRGTVGAGSTLVRAVPGMPEGVSAPALAGGRGRVRRAGGRVRGRRAPACRTRRCRCGGAPSRRRALGAARRATGLG